MNTDQEIINQLSEIISQERASFYNKDQTFFEIIGRVYDEDLISRYIAHTIRTNKTFAEQLINYALKESHNEYIFISDSDISVKCEKAMNDGRADIFIEADEYTLTIENKIRSWEHDDQTQIYFNYVNTNYPGKKNGFLFLKPNWNQSPCKCENFKTLTYEKLTEFLITDDEKIIDLKKHIEKYFIEEHRMSENLIAENYVEIKRIYEEFNRFDNNARNYIKHYFTKEIVFLADQNEIRGSSYRILKNNWGASNYYFYVEILVENNDLNAISVQGTVWYRPREKNNPFANYLSSHKDVKETAKVHVIGSSHAWFIPFKESFKSDKTIMSNEWKNELRAFSLDNAKKALIEIEKLYDDFISENSDLIKASSVADATPSPIEKDLLKDSAH